MQSLATLRAAMGLSALLALTTTYLLGSAMQEDEGGARTQDATTKGASAKGARPQLHPQTTALIVVDRQRYRTPEGGYITVTHYNTGMTCYRSENHHIAFACEGGTRRAARPYITPQQREQEREHLRRVRETIHPTDGSTTEAPHPSTTPPTELDKSLQSSK